MGNTAVTVKFTLGAGAEVLDPVLASAADLQVIQALNSPLVMGCWPHPQLNPPPRVSIIRTSSLTEVDSRRVAALRRLLLRRRPTEWFYFFGSKESLSTSCFGFRWPHIWIII